MRFNLDYTAFAYHFGQFSERRPTNTILELPKKTDIQIGRLYPDRESRAIRLARGLCYDFKNLNDEQLSKLLLGAIYVFDRVREGNSELRELCPVMQGLSNNRVIFVRIPDRFSPAMEHRQDNINYQKFIGTVCQRFYGLDAQPSRIHERIQSAEFTIAPINIAA
jgi:hypothetical protein